LGGAELLPTGFSIAGEGFLRNGVFRKSVSYLREGEKGNKRGICWEFEMGELLQFRCYSLLAPSPEFKIWAFPFGVSHLK
jgi:hypothetical protein